MAVYIDDAGAYGFDALFVGVEDTAWSRSTTDECIWFSSTGTCETGFTLPDTEWLVYEVYGMTGVTADYTTLTGSTQLHGRKEYTTTIGTVLTTINAWRTAFNAGQGANYTTYELIVTHYKGSSLADIYEADETTAFSTATHEDAGFTAGDTWTLGDGLLSDSAVTDPYGPELLPSLSDSGWGIPAGWTVVGETFEVNVPTTIYGGVEFLGTCEIGKTYKVDFTVSSYTSGNIQTIRPITGTVITSNTDVSNEAEATFTDFRLRNTVDNNIYTISNLSMKELL